MALVCVSCGKDKNIVSKSNTRTIRDIIEELAVYYGTYGNDANKNIESLLTELDGIAPVTGEKWRSIIALWKSVNGDLSLHYDVLPDGLPDTDELCMVALGFQLNPDGIIREELIERL